MTTIRTKVEHLKAKLEKSSKIQALKSTLPENRAIPSISEQTSDNALPLHDRVIEILRSIYDPELPVNIYDLGLIYKVEIDEENKAYIEMTLTTPNCPVAETFPQTVQDRVLAVPGITGVKLELVWEPPWDKDKMSEAARLQLNLL